MRRPSEESREPARAVIYNYYLYFPSPRLASILIDLVCRVSSPVSTGSRYRVGKEGDGRDGDGGVGVA